MTTESNKQLARTFMRLLSSGQLEQAANCLKEDMQWKIVSTSRPTVYTGAQIIGAAKAMIAASTDGKFSMSPIGMIAEGDKVAIEAESLMNLKDGKIYNNKYHMLWVVRDDKVIECREYADTAHAMDVLSNVLAGVATPE
jgi:ketosteroid isomerase-like protein